MGKDKKSGGFFAAFRTPTSSANEAVGSQLPSPTSVPARSGSVSPEVRVPAVSAASSSPVVPARSVPPPAVQPEPAIDTVAAFKTLCQSLIDIAASQLKVAEMVVNMLASSLNKISDGAKPKK
jgi:hypothetical protein